MLTKLPDLAFEILRLLTTNESLDQEVIEDLLDTDTSSVKYAIRRLQENDLIQQIPDLMDMRSVKYRLPHANEYEKMLSQVSPDLAAELDKLLQFDAIYGIHSKESGNVKSD